MTEELTAINILETTVNWFKEFEDEVRQYRQDIEKDLRNIKLRRELQSRQNVTPPEAAVISDPENAPEGTR